MISCVRISHWLITVFVSFLPLFAAESVVYTVENRITQDENVFQATLKLPSTGQTFRDIMEAAAEVDQRFRFRIREHGELGHFVIEINGIRENPTKERFWALLKRMDVSDCALNIGINSYVPYNNEHLAFSYVTWDLFKRIPTCAESRGS